MLRKYIGVAAYSGFVNDDVKEKVLNIFRNIKEFCNDDLIIVVGGYEGLMKHIVDYALSLNFKVVILPPIEQENRSFPDNAIVIKTGSTYTVRSVFLVHTSNVLIVVGGGSGSLHELVAAYNEGKPIYVLTNTGLPTDIAENIPEKIDYRISITIKKFKDPKDLAKELCLEIIK
jgi:uncharacterized protein (TIGR00725 family)